MQYRKKSKHVKKVLMPKFGSRFWTVYSGNRVAYYEEV